MIWKTPENRFLVQGDRHPIPNCVNLPLQLASGDSIEEAAEYFEIADSGTVVRGYSAPSNHGYEDELWVVNIHAVIATTLYRITWMEKFEHEPRVEQKTVLDNLESYEGALPFDFTRAIEEYRRREAPKYDGWKPPERMAQNPSALFAELEKVCDPLKRLGERHVSARNGVEKLFLLIDALETAHQAMVDREWECDNIDAIHEGGRYRRAQTELQAAAEKVAAACRYLL